MEAEWYRRNGDEVIWRNSGYGWYNMGNEGCMIIFKPEGLPFLSLPHPDRVFTRAKDYTSGNYKYLPGTHIMSASGCWWGKCTFCVENKGCGDSNPQGIKKEYQSKDISSAAVNDVRYSPSVLSDKLQQTVSIQPPYEVREVNDVISEIEEIKLSISSLGNFNK